MYRFYSKSVPVGGKTNTHHLPGKTSGKTSGNLDT